MWSVLWLCCVFEHGLWKSFTPFYVSKLLASSCFSVFRIHCPHPLDHTSADGVLIGVVVALPFSCERELHIWKLSALPTLLSKDSKLKQDMGYFREIGRENKKAKRKEQPTTLICILTLLWFEVVKPCVGCRGGQHCWLRLLHSLVLLSMAKRPGGLMRADFTQWSLCPGGPAV